MFKILLELLFFLKNCVTHPGNAPAFHFLVILDGAVKVSLTFWASIETKEAFVSTVDSFLTEW